MSLSVLQTTMMMGERCPVGVHDKRVRAWRAGRGPYSSYSPAPKFIGGETEGSDLGLMTQIFPLGGTADTMRCGLWWRSQDHCKCYLGIAVAKIEPQLKKVSPLSILFKSSHPFQEKVSASLWYAFNTFLTLAKLPLSQRNKIPQAPSSI